MKKTLLLFSMLLMLLVSSCGDDYKEKIQGKWYADFTEQANSGMSTLMALDFSENFMNLTIEVTDIVDVDTKGTYTIVGNVITPKFGNSQSEYTLSPKLESALREMGVDDSMMPEVKEEMIKQIKSGAGENPFSDMGTLTIAEITDSKLVLENEDGEKITFTREKPLLKSALPELKKEMEG